MFYSPYVFPLLKILTQSVEDGGCGFASTNIGDILIKGKTEGSTSDEKCLYKKYQKRIQIDFDEQETYLDGLTKSATFIDRASQ